MVVLVNYIGKILVNYIGKILVNYIGGIIRNKDNMHHSCFTKCMEMESFIIYGNGNIWKLQNCKNGWTTKHCNMVLIWFIKFIPSRKLSHNYGKSPCYSWGNSLFLWPCSIANCWHNHWFDLQTCQFYPANPRNKSRKRCSFHQNKLISGLAPLTAGATSCHGRDDGSFLTAIQTGGFYHKTQETTGKNVGTMGT
jgi:hypothetical protein